MPSWRAARCAHSLGTDQLGRDLFLRSLIGLQNALLIGIATVVLMFTVGCAIGLVAGYRGGWTDTILMRLTDAQLSIPLIILAITILTVVPARRPTRWSWCWRWRVGRPTPGSRGRDAGRAAQGICPRRARSSVPRICGSCWC